MNTCLYIKTSRAIAMVKFAIVDINSVRRYLSSSNIKQNKIVMSNMYLHST